MQNQNFDMEVTDYRFNEMKNLLARLYAHQIGMEIKSIKTYPKGPEGKTQVDFSNKSAI